MSTYENLVFVSNCIVKKTYVNTYKTENQQYRNFIQILIAGFEKRK